MNPSCEPVRKRNMNETYTEKITVRSSDCDIRGRITVGSLLRYLQETASAHVTSLGCGPDDLLRSGCAWIISKYDISVGSYPLKGDTVFIETLPLANRHLYFPRYFRVFDEEMNPVINVSSMWSVFDLDTRKVCIPDGMQKLIPVNPDPGPLLCNIPKTDELPVKRSFDYLPVYTDFDSNGHVNNSKYADILCNALGFGIFNANMISFLSISYQSELLPGNVMNISVETSETAFCVTGYSSEKTVFRGKGLLSRS